MSQPNFETASTNGTEDRPRLKIRPTPLNSPLALIRPANKQVLQRSTSDQATNSQRETSNGAYDTGLASSSRSLDYWQALPMPPSPSQLTPNTKTYPAYERWLREEAGIIAPKVHVIGFHGDAGAGAGGLGSARMPTDRAPSKRHVKAASFDSTVSDSSGGGGSNSRVRQHRGLYSTERIEPGERILHIPSRCMIGMEMLSERGQALLEAKGDGPAGHPDENEASQDQIRAEMQNELIMLIEEIRTMAMERQSLGGEYEWKADDSVALFLVGCRKIQSLVPFRAAGKEGENAQDEDNEDYDDNVQTVQQIGDEEADEKDKPPPCFVPHVSMLPHSFPTNRLYYSPDELERIGGEVRTDGKRITRKDMLRQIETDWQELIGLLKEYYISKGGMEAAKHVYKYSQNSDGEQVGSWYSCFVLDPSEDLTIDVYKWALSNIYSRSTDFPFDDGSQGDGDGNDDNKVHIRRVIAPLLDVMNHFHASEVRPEMDQYGNISLYNGPKEAIEPQTEILLNYGDFPNEKLLLVYGFFFFFSDD